MPLLRRVFEQNTSNRLGYMLKNDSISFMADRMSFSVLTIRLSINQPACFVKFFAEIGILHSSVLRQIDTAPEQVLERILEIEEIIGIIQQLDF